jgi:hypothetical protein
MKLVGGDEHGLRQIERRVGRRGNGDDQMGTIERGVVEPAILAAEEQRHRSVRRVAEEVDGSLAGRNPLSLRGAAPRTEARDADTIGKGSIEIVEMPDRRHDVPRVVGDSFDPLSLVFHGPHEPQGSQPHVLHRADDTGDVDRVERLVENDVNGVERRGGRGGVLGHGRARAKWSRRSRD